MFRVFYDRLLDQGDRQCFFDIVKVCHLWVREVFSVFYDRLVDQGDRQCFFDIVKVCHLWVREVFSVFYDRLVDQGDRQCFFDIVKVCHERQGANLQGGLGVRYPGNFGKLHSLKCQCCVIGG